MSHGNYRFGKWRIVSTSTFDNLNIDRLDDELCSLGFVSDYSFCDDGLLELTIISKRKSLLSVELEE